VTAHSVAKAFEHPGGSTQNRLVFIDKQDMELSSDMQVGPLLKWVKAAMPGIFSRDRARLLFPSIKVSMYYTPSMSVAQAIAKVRLLSCSTVKKDAGIDRIFFDCAAGSTRFKGAGSNECLWDQRRL
jgi:hypothetical protein